MVEEVIDSKFKEDPESMDLGKINFMKINSVLAIME